MGQQQQVRRALRRGHPVTDRAFDLIYPPGIQRVSNRFWTPVHTALTASGWLKALDCNAVLDVGSGAGKFCIVASLALGRPIVGVEQRSELADVAQRAAATYRARAQFVVGTLDAVDPAAFDCFYLFNPFAENVFDQDERLDSAVELSETRWFDDLALVERWFDTAREGTSIVTYNGFGGRIPGSYQLRRSVLVDGNWLRLWVKRSPVRAVDAFFIEVDDVVLSSGNLDAIAEHRQPADERERMRLLIARPLGQAVR